MRIEITQKQAKWLKAVLTYVRSNIEHNLIVFPESKADQNAHANCQAVLERLEDALLGL